MDYDLDAALSDYVHREISRQLASRSGMKAAEITSYDSKNHLIKAKIQPEGWETGWFAPHTVGLGIAVGQSVGDQIKVGFLGGDIESPVSMGPLHSDKNRAPEAKSKELVITRAGATIKIDKDGNISHTTSGKMTFNASGLEVTGDFKASGGVFTHNGKDVGSTHKHGGIQVGPANTDVPI